VWTWESGSGTVSKRLACDEGKALFLTRSTGAVAAVATVMFAVVSPAAAEDAAASAQVESPLDPGRVDVAAISLAGGVLRLGTGDGTDPESVVYATGLSPDGVEVGWDTSEIGAGEVFGDAVVFRPLAVDGPAEFHAEPLRLPVGERGAITWTFSAPGRYTLTFVVEANLLTGEPVGAEERYTVEVRPEPADTPTSPSTPPPTTAPPSVAPEARVLPAAPLVAAQPAPTTSGRVVLDEGHVDAVAPRLLDGKLQLQVKDGTRVGQAGGQVRWREPGDVTFHVKPVAKAALPNDTKLAFLGKPGAEIFLLSQQQQSGILWTGWSTEELHADQVTGPVTWRLTTVDGPGAFGIFTTGSFGDSTVVFNSTDGLPDGHPVDLGTHAHANWGFAKQGTYRLTFDVAATLTGGQTVTDTELYTFAVGAVDPNNVTPSGDGNGGGDGSGAGSGDRTPGLADTGATGVLPLAVGGLVFLGVGGAAVLVGRRKRESR
jgi:surface-anchored protein/LPXTG-motif cell wall-anchored protein